MADDIAEITEITLSDGPSSVDVGVFNGVTGARGTWVIPGSGNPANYYDPVRQKYVYDDPTNALPELVAQFYDWYLDLDTSSPTYLATFQLKETGQWEKIFKVVPNTYNTNRVLTFTGGVATTSVVVLKETLLLEQKFGNNFNLSNLDINIDIDLESIAPDLPYPVMPSFTVGTVTSDSTTYTFPLTIVATQVHPVNGLEAVSGNRIAHISISVI